MRSSKLFRMQQINRFNSVLFLENNLCKTDAAANCFCFHFHFVFIIINFLKIKSICLCLCIFKFIQVGNRDTLTSVAARFDTTPGELTSLNKLNSSFIYPGQSLLVPDKTAASSGENISDAGSSSDATALGGSPTEKTRKLSTEEVQQEEKERGKCCHIPISLRRFYSMRSVFVYPTKLMQNLTLTNANFQYIPSYLPTKFTFFSTKCKTKTDDSGLDMQLDLQHR